MKVRAKEFGYYGTRRRAGDVFDIPDDEPLGSWMEEVESKKRGKRQADDTSDQTAEPKLNTPVTGVPDHLSDEQADMYDGRADQPELQPLPEQNGVQVASSKDYPAENYPEERGEVEPEDGSDKHAQHGKKGKHK